MIELTDFPSGQTFRGEREKKTGKWGKRPCTSLPSPLSHLISPFPLTDFSQSGSKFLRKWRKYFVAKTSGEFTHHDACDVALLFQDLFDLFSSEQPASAHTWAGWRDLLFPDIAVHVLGPERPGTALPGSGSIDIAFVVFEKRAVLVSIFEFMETVDFFHISRRKLR